MTGVQTCALPIYDFFDLNMAIERAHKEKVRPVMIIMDTIKGKGCSFAERLVSNHNMTFDYEKAKEAIRLLDNRGN